MTSKYPTSKTPFRTLLWRSTLFLCPHLEFCLYLAAVRIISPASPPVPVIFPALIFMLVPWPPPSLLEFSRLLPLTCIPLSFRGFNPQHFNCGDNPSAPVSSFSPAFLLFISYISPRYSSFLSHRCPLSCCLGNNDFFSLQTHSFSTYILVYDIVNRVRDLGFPQNPHFLPPVLQLLILSIT